MRARGLSGWGELYWDEERGGTCFLPDAPGAREITYRCRDIGYGVEEGDARGVWGERQWTGSRLFTPTDRSGPALYLFDDEIESDEPAGGGR